MLKSIAEQINRGNLLIERAKRTGKDVEPLVSRVEKLKEVLSQQIQETPRERDSTN
jgi:hypothetical protein